MTGRARFALGNGRRCHCRRRVECNERGREQGQCRYRYGTMHDRRLNRFRVLHCRTPLSEPIAYRHIARGTFQRPHHTGTAMPSNIQNLLGAPAIPHGSEHRRRRMLPVDSGGIWGGTAFDKHQCPVGGGLLTARNWRFLGAAKLPGDGLRSFPALDDM